MGAGAVTGARVVVAGAGGATSAPPPNRRATSAARTERPRPGHVAAEAAV